MTELPNPFQNGKLVAVNYDQREYVKQSVQRGHPDYAMSRSDLMEFSKCPSRWRRGYREAEEGTDATEWGSLIDCLLFDKDRWPERFAVTPETYPSEKEGDKPWNGNSKWCKNWMEEQGDRVCLKRDEMDSAIAAVNRIREDNIIQEILRTSDFQVYCTAEYRDRDTGVVVPVKTLSDIVPKDHRDPMQKAYDSEPPYVNSIIDFKTSRNANPMLWDREVNQKWYDAQGALNLDVYNASAGEERVDFYHIVQENYAPYETSFPILRAEFVQLGRDKYLKALRRYAECIKTGRWPGYDESYPLLKINGHPAIEPNAYMLRDMP